jgi:DNA-binding NarL/FixJ family response regulator
MSIRLLLVDDRDEVRKEMRETIELVASGSSVELEIEDEFPFFSVEDYAPFIQEHDIHALLLDERLSEQMNRSTQQHVGYLGHDVLEKLRSALPDFPVYVVTTYPNDEDLVSNASEVEDIIDRIEFSKSVEKYVSRIQRAASRFLESRKDALDKLERLSLLAASGALDVKQEEELNSVRAFLSLPYEEGSSRTLSGVVEEARALAEKAEQLLEALQNSKVERK